METSTNTPPGSGRLDYLDAVRAFALLLGVVFHAGLSFMPHAVGWAVMDVSTSPLMRGFFLVSHSFRMPLFFLIAGYFSHMSFHRKGAGGFLCSRFTRLVIPFVVGWFILWPLVASGWIMGWASMQGDVEVWEGLKGGFLLLKNLPEGIFTSTHLWFLHYLFMATVIVFALRTAAQSLGTGYHRLTGWGDQLLAWLSNRWWAPWALAVPTARLLWIMPGWGLDTPDKTLVPNIPVLMLYGGCFLLGWALHRSPNALIQLTRMTVDRWILTTVAAVVVIWLSPIQTDPSHPDYQLARLAFTLCYAIMLWGLVMLSIGAFRWMIRRPYPHIRYIADASYWIYLIHLPIVVWLQIALAEWQINWSFKLILVSAVTLLFSLATYALFVRSTRVGWLLNGKTVPFNAGRYWRNISEKGRSNGTCEPAASVSTRCQEAKICLSR